MALANEANVSSRNGYYARKGCTAYPAIGSDRGKRGTVQEIDNSFGDSNLKIKFENGKVAVYKSTEVDVYK